MFGYQTKVIVCLINGCSFVNYHLVYGNIAVRVNFVIIIYPAKTYCLNSLISMISFCSILYVTYIVCICFMKGSRYGC